MKTRPEAEKGFEGAGPEENVIETRVGRIWLGGDGIVRQVIVPGAELVLADAEENIEALSRICEGRRAPLFADGRDIRSVTREARQLYGGEGASRSVCAVGLLVGSPLSRLIGNFFLRLNKPRVPMRLFTSEAEALEWLRQFVGPREGAMTAVDLQESG